MTSVFVSYSRSDWRTAALLFDWLAAARLPSANGHPQTDRPEGFAAVEVNLLIKADEDFRRYRSARRWSNQIRDAAIYCGKAYGVTLDQLRHNDNRADMVEIRQKAMAFVRVVTGKNFHEIGDKFNRPHSSVIHACDKYEAAIRLILTPVDDD